MVKTSAFAPGTQVRIRRGDAIERRIHLWRHAKADDVGVVQDPDLDAKARWIGHIWVIVQFDGCRQFHRLAPDELEMA